MFAPDAPAHPVPSPLDSAGVDSVLLGLETVAGRVTLLPAGQRKRLEFDSVVLLEPADAVASSPYGLRLLYVALTRAVSSLLVLHSRDLPAEPG